jgi:hypothetical protein
VRYASAGRRDVDAAQFASSSLLSVPKSFGSRQVSRDAAIASLVSMSSRLQGPDAQYSTTLKFLIALSLKYYQNLHIREV